MTERSDPLLACQGISMAFGGVVALESVDLTVARGEIHGLIGPNGSGKSTLLNIICGFYRPDRGSVTFDAQRIDGLPPHVVPRLGIARTFQNLRLCEELSVLDNVLMALHLRFLTKSGAAWPWVGALVGWPRSVGLERDAQREARAALRDVRLDDMADRKAGAMSYGQKKRLELARVLLIKPRLLLLDEPTAGLSPDEAVDMMQVLRDVRVQKQATMIIIEHRLEWVMDIADRITVLDTGRNTADGTPEEIQQHPDVVAAYIGTVRV